MVATGKTNAFGILSIWIMFLPVWWKGRFPNISCLIAGCREKPWLPHPRTTLFVPSRPKNLTLTGRSDKTISIHRWTKRAIIEALRRRTAWFEVCWMPSFFMVWTRCHAWNRKPEIRSAIWLPIFWRGPPGILLPGSPWRRSTSPHQSTENAIFFVASYSARVDQKRIKENDGECFHSRMSIILNSIALMRVARYFLLTSKAQTPSKGMAECLRRKEEKRHET